MKLQELPESAAARSYHRLQLWMSALGSVEVPHLLCSDEPALVTASAHLALLLDELQKLVNLRRYGVNPTYVIAG
jgi:hypothetical protein